MIAHGMDPVTAGWMLGAIDELLRVEPPNGLVEISVDAHELVDRVRELVVARDRARDRARVQASRITAAKVILEELATADSLAWSATKAQQAIQLLADEEPADG